MTTETDKRWATLRKSIADCKPTWITQAEDDQFLDALTEKAREIVLSIRCDVIEQARKLASASNHTSQVQQELRKVYERVAITKHPAIVTMVMCDAFARYIDEVQRAPKHSRVDHILAVACAIDEIGRELRSASSAQQHQMYNIGAIHIASSTMCTIAYVRARWGAKGQEDNMRKFSAFAKIYYNAGEPFTLWERVRDLRSACACASASADPPASAGKRTLELALERHESDIFALDEALLLRFLENSVLSEHIQPEAIDECASDIMFVGGDWWQVAHMRIFEWARANSRAVIRAIGDPRLLGLMRGAIARVYPADATATQRAMSVTEILCTTYSSAFCIECAAAQPAVAPATESELGEIDKDACAIASAIDAATKSVLARHVFALVLTCA